MKGIAKKLLPAMALILAVAICGVVLTACGAAASDDGGVADEAQGQSATDQSTDGEGAESELSQAEQTLAAMTLEDKVAQLFMVTPETLADPAGAAAAATSALEDPQNATSVPAVTEISADIQQNLQKYPVGGVILFAQNIVDPNQTKVLTATLQEAAENTPHAIPLFIAVDEEGGLVARLANNEDFDLPQYESAQAVGASGDSEDAHAMGQAIGSYLKEYGFNLDFAPDADVLSNPENTVIGNRSFSTDPTVAASMAGAFAQGLRENGVRATFKHFPGHGDTAQDSHSELATSNKTLDELNACEFLPFRQATDEDFVMVGHIAVPEVTGDDTPATLSEQLVTGQLRQNLGFDGIVVTDALNMGAIINNYGAGDCAVKALQAGCDILLMPIDFEQAYSAVIGAVRDGVLTEDRIDESVLRILEAKYGAETSGTGEAGEPSGASGASEASESSAHVG